MGSIKLTGSGVYFHHDLPYHTAADDIFFSLYFSEKIMLEQRNC